MSIVATILCGCLVAAGSMVLGTPTTRSSFMGSILFNSTAMVWFVVPLTAFVVLREDPARVPQQLLRSGSRLARRSRLLRRALAEHGLIVVVSSCAWSAISALAFLGRPIPLVDLGAQSLVLIVGSAVFRVATAAAVDRGGRSLGVCVASAIWVWLLASERAVIPPSSALSAMRLIDARVSLSTIDSALLTVAVHLAAITALLLLAAAADRGSRVGRRPLRASPSIPVVVFAALLVGATMLSTSADAPFWSVATSVLGSAAPTNANALLPLLLAFIVPWQVQLALADTGRETIGAEMLRYGSVGAWLRRRVLHWGARVGLVMTAVPVVLLSTYVATGGSIWSAPPGGWVPFSIVYALTVMSAGVLVIVTLHLAFLYSTRDPSAATVLTVLVACAIALAAAPKGLPRPPTELTKGLPRLTAELTMTLGGSGWIGSLASSVALMGLALVAGAVLSRRARPRL